MGSPPFVAQVAVIAAAAAAVQGAPTVSIVDLGLLQPLSGDAAAKLAEQIAVQTCVGLYNRDPEAVAVYTLMDSNDPAWLADTDGLCVEGFKYSVTASDEGSQHCAKRAKEPGLEMLKPIPRIKFLRDCLSAKRHDGTPMVAGAILFNAAVDKQQLVTPMLITLAAVLDAVPMQASDPLLSETTVIYNAAKEWAGFDTVQATRYIHTHHVNKTTGMAQMNPGYNKSSWKPAEGKVPPKLQEGGIRTGLVDYIVKEKLFNFMMWNECIEGTPDHALMQQIVTDNPWPRPIGVMGYDDTWPEAGDLYEAETRCVMKGAGRNNMGQIASSNVNNFAYYSRKGPISQPLLQPPLDSPEFNASKTYMAFVIGDGDNTAFVRSSRRAWFLDRNERCAKGGNSYDSCFPLLWSISPALLHLAPDWLRWYYNGARKTGHDYFVLPPSGDLYSYPGEMQPKDQAEFVRRTERDCELLNTSGTVEWEWFGTWEQALQDYYPQYTARGVVRSLYSVNVPFMMPVAIFKEDEYYKVIDNRGKGEPVVFFKPREWRGATSNTSKQNLFVPEFAKEINSYPRGTVTTIYMTSDGGGKLQDPYDLVALLDEHVEVVNYAAVADFAVRQHHRSQQLGGQDGNS